MAEELHYPDTTYIQNIDDRVFQSIVLECLGRVPGVTCATGNLFDNLLGRGSDRLRGIHIAQEAKSHSVGIKVEVDIEYGLSIPEKSEEIQLEVSTAITKLTGLHVSSVHVIFKGVSHPAPAPHPLPEEFAS